MAKHKFDSRIIPLFLTIFLDAVGWGIIFPVLTPLLIDNATSLFSFHTTIGTRNLYYEFAIAIYCLFMFLGAPFLGSLSDRYGRKNILLMALGGTSLGFAVSGFGIEINNLIIIFLGRIIAGITAASLPIAQAAIIDISTEENKASRLGIIVFANGAGFACGPSLGGLLMKIFHANYQIPFYVTAMLLLMCIGLVQYLFHETFLINKSQKINILTGLRNIIEAFSYTKTRYLSLGLLSFMLGYIVFFTTLPIFLTERFHESGVSIGYFITYFAIAFSVGLIVLLPKITAKFQLTQIVHSSIIVQFICYPLFFISHHILWLLLIIIPIAITVAFSYVGLVTLLSNNTDKEHQGKIMGVVGSIIALTWGVAPLISGELEKILFLGPYIAALGLLLLSIKFLSYQLQLSKNSYS